MLLFSAGDDGTVRLWNLHDKRNHRTLSQHMGVATSIAFTPDAKRLISVSRDKVVNIWCTKTWALLKELPIYEAVESIVCLPVHSTASDDSFFLTAGDSGNVRAWRFTASSKSKSPDANTLTQIALHSVRSSSHKRADTSAANLVTAVHYCAQSKQAIAVTADNDIFILSLGFDCTDTSMSRTDRRTISHNPCLHRSSSSCMHAYVHLLRIAPVDRAQMHYCWSCQ
jgi:WD40 repeat protein